VVAATSGKAGLLLAGAFLVAASALGCSGSPAATRSTQTAATERPSPTPPSSARQDGTFCTVELPESWRSALAQGKISLPDTDYLYAKAVAPDGTQIFGELYSDAWSGVVAVDRQGSIKRIRAFANPRADHASVAFDGRWLVWTELHSITNWSDWDIRAWDSSTGEVFDIATAPRVNGATVSGPFVIPVASEGRAAWVQANPSGKGEVHLYDLARRQDRVLSAGTVVPPVLFWGAKLMWVEKDLPGGGGHLAMADAATGEPLTVPRPLASLTSIATLAASGDLVAWSEDYHTVSVWRVGEPKAEQIFAAGPDDGVDWITIAGDLVEWRGLKAPMVADLRSGSVTPLTEGNGGAYTNGEALVLEKPLGPLVKPAEDEVALNHFEADVVDVTKLPPLPGCPS
jgi:hypothetical protein